MAAICFRFDDLLLKSRKQIVRTEADLGAADVSGLGAGLTLTQRQLLRWTQTGDGEGDQPEGGGGREKRAHAERGGQRAGVSCRRGGGRGGQRARGGGRPTDADAEYGIAEVARIAGTTSRTLRHYGDVGLLEPSRVGANGYRYYDTAALTRLQRILMLRQLGLGVAAIAEVLDATDDTSALQAHLEWLRAESERLARQIASVERTITSIEKEVPIMARDMFDGFDHTQYKEEVEQRWGAQAYADSDRWWRGLGPEGQQAFKDEHARDRRDLGGAAGSGCSSGGRGGAGAGPPAPRLDRRRLGEQTAECRPAGGLGRHVCRRREVRRQLRRSGRGDLRAGCAHALRHHRAGLTGSS